MILTKKIFGAKLILKIEDGYDCKKISEWAEGLYYQYNDKIEISLKEIILNLSVMNVLSIEASKDDLIEIAINLIKNK